MRAIHWMISLAVEGTLNGDRLAGTFITRGARPGEVSGTWHVERRGR